MSFVALLRKNCIWDAGSGRLMTKSIDGSALNSLLLRGCVAIRSEPLDKLGANGQGLEFAIKQYRSC
jgi:hypothetical protein